MDSSAGDITGLLAAWARGNDNALEQLMPLVYGELHRIARAHLQKQSAGHTLQATALLHEAFVKLAHQRDKTYENRKHFFVVYSSAMRHVLVNYAKASKAQKRNKGGAYRPLKEADLAGRTQAREVLALHDALDRLKEIDDRKSQVVELRYFGGLNTDEIAQALEVSPITVSRDWRVARAWLAREIGRDCTAHL